MNRWSDDVDLPKLQSITLGERTLAGDNKRKAMKGEPYNYRNKLKMRSDQFWSNRWVDLPSLKRFNADDESFMYIGSVTLKSIDL